MKTTQDLRNNVIAIGEQLKAGKISNAEARTLLYVAKITLDTLRTEMAATQIGTAFGAIELDADDRMKIHKLKQVA